MSQSGLNSLSVRWKLGCQNCENARCIFQIGAISINKLQIWDLNNHILARNTLKITFQDTILVFHGFSPLLLELAGWRVMHWNHLSMHPRQTGRIKNTSGDLKWTWLDVNFELEQYLGSDWCRYTSPQQHKYRQDRILKNG